MSDGNEVKKFSRRRKTVPIELESENGEYESYTIRELSGTGRDEYMNIYRNRVGDKEGSMPKNFTGLHAELLSRTVFDMNGEAVSVKEIQTWPASTQSELFKIAQDISGLGKKAEEEAKNV